MGLEKDTGDLLMVMDSTVAEADGEGEVKVEDEFNSQGLEVTSSG